MEDEATLSKADSTRAGYVALVGRPNAGKSSLLNAMIGERLSIVTPRAQTTRERVMGILTTDRAQIVFVDTPGLLEPRYLLQEAMLHTALAAIHDADLVLLLLDGLDPDGTVGEGPTLDALRGRGAALFAAVNKVDVASVEAVERQSTWSEATLGVRPVRVSAVSGEGVAALREALIEALPESPFLYPADEIATQPVRFFVAELIRETIFEAYHEEIPYSSFVAIEEYRESTVPVYIRATVFVERESQKRILIGRKGASIRELGRRAREKVEAFVQAPVYLDLWVKAMPKWRQKRGALKHLGFPLPEER